MSIDNSDPRLRSLLRQAERVAQAGKRAAAEQLYRQLLGEFPESPQGLVGLAQVVSGADEKRPLLERALSFDPDNEVAKLELARLNGEILPETAVAAPEEGFEQLQAKLTAAVESDKEAVKETAVSTPPLLSEEELTKLTCYRHPQRTTSLRCNNCGNPICIQCAKRTPVGYRCPQCVKELEDAYFNATPFHYALAFFVTLPLAAIAGYITQFVSYFVIFLAAGAGSLIGRIVFRAIGRQRGRWLPHLVAATIFLGMIGVYLPIVALAILGGAPGAGIASLIWPGIGAFIAAGTAFYWVK